jgi:hypothetical protein
VIEDEEAFVACENDLQDMNGDLRRENVMLRRVVIKLLVEKSKAEQSSLNLERGCDTW